MKAHSLTAKKRLLDCITAIIVTLNVIMHRALSYQLQLVFFILFYFVLLLIALPHPISPRWVNSPTCLPVLFFLNKYLHCALLSQIRTNPSDPSSSAAVPLLMPHRCHLCMCLNVYWTCLSLWECFLFKLWFFVCVLLSVTLSYK